MNDMPSSYASALLSLCSSKEEKASYAEALRALKEIIHEDKQIQIFLSSPDIHEEEKLAVLQKGIQGSERLPHLLPFLRTIISHHRMGSFGRIVDAYISLVNQENGVLEGYIYSSSKLTKAQLESIEEAFKKKLGKKVILKNILDPTLLAGVRVALDGKVYDSSVKGRLEDLRHHLNQGGNTL